MYRAIGTHQIEPHLTLTDFTFQLVRLHLNQTRQTSQLEILYDGWQVRLHQVNAYLSAEEAILTMKLMYPHEVMTEQVAAAIPMQVFTHLDQVEADMAFGLWMVKKYLAENRSLTLSASQVLELTVAFEQVKKLFDVGSIETGLYVLMQIPTEGNGGPVAWTEQRRLTYIGIIQQYIQTGQYDAL